MHAHVSYLTDECPACLLMLTVERDAFFELSASKEKIVAVRAWIYFKFRIDLLFLSQPSTITIKHIIYFRVLKKQGQSKL